MSPETVGMIAKIVVALGFGLVALAESHWSRSPVCLA